MLNKYIIYDNIWLKKCGGASSQPLKTIRQQSLEGLVEIYKMTKMLELQSQRLNNSCNSENGWRWMNMMHNMKYASSNGSLE